MIKNNKNNVIVEEDFRRKIFQKIKEDQNEFKYKFKILK